VLVAALVTVLRAVSMLHHHVLPAWTRMLQAL
jgi:hypothetical protein